MQQLNDAKAAGAGLIRNWGASNFPQDQQDAAPDDAWVLDEAMRTGLPVAVVRPKTGRPRDKLQQNC